MFIFADKFPYQIKIHAYFHDQIYILPKKYMICALDIVPLNVFAQNITSELGEKQTRRVRRRSFFFVK